MEEEMPPGATETSTEEQQNTEEETHQETPPRDETSGTDEATGSSEKKIPNDILIEETRTATHAAISQKAEQVAKSGNTSGYGENALAGIYVINTAQAGDTLPITPTDTLKFRRGDKDMEMVGITVNEDGTFRCSVQESGNPDSGEMATFTREGIIDAIITSDTRTTNAILSLLPEGQRELANLHVDILDNGENALEGKTPEQVSQMITKAGKEVGLFTTSEMKSKANNVSESQRQEFLDLLEGRNLVIGETLNRFLQMTDVNGLVGGAATDLRTAEAALKENPNSEDLKEAVDVAREYLRRFNEAAEKVKSGEMRVFMENLAKGNVNSDTARTIKDAIISDNIDAAVDALFPDLQEQGGTPKDIAKRARKKRETKKKLQMAGGGLGILAILLLMAGAEMGKTMASQK